MIRVADQSRALTEDILSSAHERQEALGARRSWVAEFLASSRKRHLQSFRDAHARFSERVCGLAAETRAFLAQCDDEQCVQAERRQQWADERRGHATDGEAARLDAFVRMHDRHGRTHDRIACDVDALAANTHGFLRQCTAWRRGLENDVRQAAFQLRQQLAGGENARRTAFGGLRGHLAGRLADLRCGVRGHLAETRHDFTAARAAWKHLVAARWDARRTFGRS